jgi:glycosyltransferase involved in cell wall biosynthesis
MIGRSVHCGDMRRKVLFVLPSLRLGGAERQIVDLVNGLSAGPFKTHLLTFEKELDLLPFLDRTKVIFHNYPRKSKYDFAPAREIAGIIDREKIDVLHTTLQIALLYGTIGRVLARKRPRHVTAIHTTINRNMKCELFDRVLYVPLMRRCARIISVCENQKGHWSRNYPHLADRIVAIHNGIDMVRFRDDLREEEKVTIRASLGAVTGELVVGLVAGFRPEKGHEYAFRALKMLLERERKVRLVLIGDGERRPYLERLAGELGIGPQLVWLGLQQDPKPYISAVDLLLISSVAVETFSIAILEALAMGKPVIATDLGGTSEMVHDGINGFLVKPRDAREIAEKVLSLINDQEALGRLSSAARESVASRFAVGEMITKTENLLMSLY